MFCKYFVIVFFGFSTFSASASQFIINGDEVTDSATGLVWRRCTEGMVVVAGGCAGAASSFTHEAALSHATTLAISTGVSWRLPSINELAGIADKNRNNPAIDQISFPSTPAVFFWTSSPYVGDSQYSWMVSFNLGDSSINLRSVANRVRLVRAAR